MLLGASRTRILLAVDADLKGGGLSGALYLQVDTARDYATSIDGRRVEVDAHCSWCRTNGVAHIPDQSERCSKERAKHPNAAGMIDAGCYDHASSTEYGSERGGCGTAATSSSPPRQEKQRTVLAATRNPKGGRSSLSLHCVCVR